MRCKCKLFNVAGVPASDGSVIPRDVLEAYLSSSEYKLAIESKKMLGSLTHRARNLANAPASSGAALNKTIGKDDMMLLVGVSSPTHYIESLTVENDGWCYAVIKILEESGMDDEAIQSIRRLKGLLSQGIHPGVSAVVVAYWDGATNGSDMCRKIQSIKSLDVTLNPSWKDAQITEIYDDADERVFSEKDFEFKGLKAKQFSNLSELGLGDVKKSSKIEGAFTVLKAKEFSANGMVSEIKSETPSIEKSEITEEKTFSVATLKERTRFAKLSPRMRFKRLIIDYKQTIKSFGGATGMDPETSRVLKSLFTSDVLDIMKTITPDIIAGKNINTLIGASTLGKSVRVAAQKLQMPFRYAMQESAKQGFVSKARYQKIQDAYLEFIQSLIDDIFGDNPSEIPAEVDENNNK